MDSCNSASLQSSSGNDVEYDSHATTIPLKTTPPNDPMFDSLSNYFLNSNTPFPNTQSFQPPIQNTNTLYPNHAPPQLAARNPKKRSRASRRAPTTVLTTNTSNFRAMVQEFTGVASPPFTSAPPYLRRPLPQKFQPQFMTSNSVGFQEMPLVIQSSSAFSFPTETNQSFPFSNDLQSDLRNNGGFGEFGNDNNINLENNFVRSVAGAPDHVNGEGIAESWICANSD